MSRAAATRRWGGRISECCLRSSEMPNVTTRTQKQGATKAGNEAAERLVSKRAPRFQKQNKARPKGGKMRRETRPLSAKRRENEAGNEAAERKAHPRRGRVGIHQRCLCASPTQHNKACNAQYGLFARDAKQGVFACVPKQSVFAGAGRQGPLPLSASPRDPTAAPSGRSCLVSLGRRKPRLLHTLGYLLATWTQNPLTVPAKAASLP